ncbi:MAG TPA: sulfatase, partial [Planctomycetaceae bacterium]|nr:sulfatase [Planctomycetaceae bacterium]
EFGRTPLGQGNDGRDHHPNAFSVWMAGGGVKGGTVYGTTDELGWAPAENPVHVNDFQATLLRLFGLDHERLTVNHRGLGVRLTNLGGRVIEDVIA